MITKRFSLRHAPTEESQWLAEKLARGGERLGTGVETDAEGLLTLRW